MLPSHNWRFFREDVGQNVEEVSKIGLLYNLLAIASSMITAIWGYNAHPRIQPIPLGTDDIRGLGDQYAALVGPSSSRSVQRISWAVLAGRHAVPISTRGNDR